MRTATLRLCVALASVAGAQAFAPMPAVPTPQVAAVRRQPLLRQAPCRAPQPAMFLSLPKLLVSVPTLYALMSVNEYVTHRWYQHEEFNRDHAFQRFVQRLAFIFRKRPLVKADGRNNIIKIHGGGHVRAAARPVPFELARGVTALAPCPPQHPFCLVPSAGHSHADALACTTPQVEHHAETYDDMSLKKDPRWRKTKAAASLDSDRFRGTAFTWTVTGLMTIQMLPTSLPVFALLGFSLLETFAVLLPGMLLHAAVWNMLHPPMHGLPNVPASVGVPSSWLAKLRNTAYFKYIYENHQGHHVLGVSRDPRPLPLAPRASGLAPLASASPPSPQPRHRYALLLTLTLVCVLAGASQLPRVLPADRPPAWYVRAHARVGAEDASSARPRCHRALGSARGAARCAAGPSHRRRPRDRGRPHPDGVAQRSRVRVTPIGAARIPSCLDGPCSGIRLSRSDGRHRSCQHLGRGRRRRATRPPPCAARSGQWVRLPTVSAVTRL